MNNLKYPIGKVVIPTTITKKHLEEAINTIEHFPKKLELLVKNLSESELNTTYREGGWTIAQVVHHCADSHMNSYIRFKWALTENNPIIKAYDEKSWAELFDSKTTSIKLSLNLLSTLHRKWVVLLKGLFNEQLNKTFVHPETKSETSLAKNILIYAWHCNHHYAHIYNKVKQF